MKRRSFLAAGVGSAVALIGSAPVWAGDDEFWALPRRLRLWRPETKEFVDEVYWENNQPTQGYAKVSALLRDVKANQGIYMDPRLLDLMCAVQSYVSYYGYRKPLVIHSGYRTPSTNSKLEGAAKNSMHLLGKAVDFSMPDLPASYLGLLATHYQAGGVGFYLSRGFTHMDTGSVRYWSDKDWHREIRPKSKGSR